MTKQTTNNANNPMSPHQAKPSNTTRKAGGSIVNTEANKNTGGFRSTSPEATTLGTMNSIMSNQYNK
jgi:hypothetical protein|tara:strand:- start:3047 stop:3247 length:201 start_codon:yes stop_codon:yes gene_type:complete